MKVFFLVILFICSFTNELLFGQNRSYQNPPVASITGPYMVKSVTISDYTTEITLEVTSESIEDINFYFPRNGQLKDNTNSKLHSLDSTVGNIHSKKFSVFFYRLPENTKSISIYGKNGASDDIV